MKLFLAVLLASTTALAQSRADLGVNISGASRGFGYDNPSIGITVHTVTCQGRAAFEGEFDYGFYAPKAQTHDGRSASGIATGRLYFGRMFVSGGVRAGYQSTSLYSKSAAGPSGGIGFDDGNYTVQFSYDRFFDENKSDGFTGSFERIVAVGSGYLSIRPFVTVARFDTPHAIDGVNRRETGSRAGIVVAIGKIFRKTKE